MKLALIPEVIHSFPKITNLKSYFRNAHIESPLGKVPFQVNLAYESGEGPVGVLGVFFKVPTGQVEDTSDCVFYGRAS